jgi:septum formation protein
MPLRSPQVPLDYFFVLASGSPRRREFMELLGLPFIIIPPSFIKEKKPVDETPLPNEMPPALVQRLSRIKADAVAVTLPSLALPSFVSSTNNHKERKAIVIAADTIVVLENKILGKPNNATEAAQMLKQLRDQYHFVYSGLTVAAISWEPDQPQAHLSKLVTRLHQSKVWMRPYTDAEIEAYVASGDPLDKAGAYGIQNKTFAPVARLEGCFASVMGFPLGELAITLREVDVSLSPIGPLCTKHTDHPCFQK